jgi:hypothetical protein
LIWFSNMSRFEMKTWQNTIRLSKWHEEIPTDNDKVIPWIAASKTRDQKHSSWIVDWFRAYQKKKCVLVFFCVPISNLNIVSAYPPSGRNMVTFMSLKRFQVGHGKVYLAIAFLAFLSEITFAEKEKCLLRQLYL